MQRTRRAGRLLAALAVLAAPPAACNDDQEELDRAREFAACMREQGIDFPDPDRDEEGAISGPAGPVNGNQAAFDAAQKICEAETGHRMD
jgi:hypothetical protein